MLGGKLIRSVGNGLLSDAELVAELDVVRSNIGVMTSARGGSCAEGTGSSLRLIVRPPGPNKEGERSSRPQFGAGDTKGSLEVVEAGTLG